MRVSSTPSPCHCRSTWSAARCGIFAFYELAGEKQIQQIESPDRRLTADVYFRGVDTGQTRRHGVLLHFGNDAVTTDLAAWFDCYNERQTVEAGIKEGKGVFQMHHLKVRTAPALWLQEQLAAFAANFVRWAAHWLSTQCDQEPEQWLAPVAASIKTLVQVAAHTPANVPWLPGGCLLRFTDESLYAGRTIQTGGWAFQLSLPLFQSCSFEPFSTNQALIAQPLR